MLKDEIIANYLDADNLVAPYKCAHTSRNVSDNGPLFSSEWIVLLNKLGQLDHETKQAYANAIRECMDIPGLLKRSPIHTGQEGPDDYVGVGAGSYLADPTLAKEILNYSRNNKVYLGEIINDPKLNMVGVLRFVLTMLIGWIKVGFNMNNVTPGQGSSESWLGRQQQLVAHLQFAAGENPALWRKLWWCLAVVSGVNNPPSDTDSRILSWLLIQTMNKRSWICNRVVKYWYRKLYKVYPGGMKEVASIYFQAGHPFVKYWTD